MCACTYHVRTYMHIFLKSIYLLWPAVSPTAPATSNANRKVRVDRKDDSWNLVPQTPEQLDALTNLFLFCSFYSHLFTVGPRNFKPRSVFLLGWHRQDLLLKVTDATAIARLRHLLNEKIGSVQWFRREELNPGFG